MSHTGAGDQGNPGVGAGAQDPQGNQGGTNGGSGSSAGTGDGGGDAFDGNAALGALLGDNSGSDNQSGNDNGTGTADPNAGLSIEQQLENERARSRQLQLAAREQEKRAKAGNAAVKKLQDMEDAQKSELQRAQEAATRAQMDAREAQAQSHRLLAAAGHNLGPEFIDFLGSGTEDEIGARAETLSNAITEAVNAKVQEMTGSNGLPGIRGNGFPRGNRPIESLRPGGTPTGQTGTFSGNDAFRDMIGRR
jgi:hypothetical protein